MHPAALELTHILISNKRCNICYHGRNFKTPT